MLKLLKATGIAVFFIFALLSLNFLQAQDETLTITTYYPGPYGSYNELQTNKLAVGDTSGQPPANGQIYTARSVIYKPQSPLPTSHVKEGELAYNSSDESLYLHDDSDWRRWRGGMSYTKYCFNSDVYGTPLCETGTVDGTVEIGTQWQCDAGFTVQKLLGSWGYCKGPVSGPASSCPGPHGWTFLPPGGSCVVDPLGRSWCAGAVLGKAYECSQ